MAIVILNQTSGDAYHISYEEEGIDAGSASVSKGYPVNNFTSVNVQVFWTAHTADVTGVSFQSSNDGSSWNTIPNSTISTTGVSGNDQITFNGYGAKWIRMTVFNPNPTDADPLLSIKINAK